MDVNGAPPSGRSTFKNTISKEDFAALLAQSKPGDTPSSNSSHASALNAESWLKDSSADSGRFIALPLSMLSLRKSEAKLSLSELLVLAYIHGFQRRDPLKGCHSNAKTIAEALGISPSALSKRLQKLKNFALIKKEGHGEEITYRVDEARWAELCGIEFIDARALHEWTSRGTFCRVPFWAIRDTDLSALFRLHLFVLRGKGIKAVSSIDPECRRSARRQQKQTSCLPRKAHKPESRRENCHLAQGTR